MSEVLSYAALKESHDRLLDENVAMKGALTSGKYLDFIKQNNWNPAVKTVNGNFSCFMDPEVDFGSMVYSFAKGLIDTAATPATSTALAAIRSQAVDEFADSQIQKSLEHRAIGNSGLADVYNDNAMDAKVFAMRLREAIELREAK
ncbi:hypothetical protein JEM67_16125 [Serratia sp. PAMC26656]|uniref:hypothetical protein n=1 Tax=Serratia sp. PAMC26656 TaxID=2775909 RepID=UPI0018F280B8|nr:hypothetical protein [Serratia sp. PAMC26656]MBJ7889417.1 hypothetical protein [Serratia sp. PAMC26656]